MKAVAKTTSLCDLATHHSPNVCTIGWIMAHTDEKWLKKRRHPNAPAVSQLLKTFVIYSHAQILLVLKRLATRPTNTSAPPSNTILVDNTYFKRYKAGWRTPPKTRWFQYRLLQSSQTPSHQGQPQPNINRLGEYASWVHICQLGIRFTLRETGL